MMKQNYYQTPAEVATLSPRQSNLLVDSKAVLNQAVADLSVAHSILHQVHWYMRGRGFMTWHPKMDDYMEEIDGYLDEMSERLITLGGAPFSTLKEFSENSQLKEVPGDYNVTIEKFDRSRSSGSGKLPACNMAVVYFNVHAPNREITIRENYESFGGNVSGVAMEFKLLGMENITKIKTR